MRRRRADLKPETFPFLAVLLAAMGALILLLFIMDRRAKAVARARLAAATLQSVEDHSREQEAIRAAHQVEWERRRQALHDELAKQAEALALKIRHVSEEEAAARDRLRMEESQAAQVRNQIHQQQMAINQDHAEAEARKQKAAQAAAQAMAQAIAQAAAQLHAAEAERARLSEELRHLEQTLADLKTVRQRNPKTFALVPYRGKHGDTRPPLCVECTNAGLIFQPEAKTISGSEEAAVRREVEHRAAGKAHDGQLPYVLFLVRPDGILSYYQALGALKGVDLDFGYEFVDAGWVLEFPENFPDPASGVTPQRTSGGPGEGGRGGPESSPAAFGGGQGPSGSPSGGGSGDKGLPGSPFGGGRAPASLPGTPGGGQGLAGSSNQTEGSGVGVSRFRGGPGGEGNDPLGSHPGAGAAGGGLAGHPSGSGSGTAGPPGGSHAAVPGGVGSGTQGPGSSPRPLSGTGGSGMKGDGSSSSRPSPTPTYPFSTPGGAGENKGNSPSSGANPPAGGGNGKDQKTPAPEKNRLLKSFPNRASPLPIRDRPFRAVRLKAAGTQGPVEAAAPHPPRADRLKAVGNPGPGETAHRPPWVARRPERARPNPGRSSPTVSGPCPWNAAPRA